MLMSSVVVLSGSIVMLAGSSLLKSMPARLMSIVYVPGFSSVL